MNPYVDPFRKYSFLYDDNKPMTCPYCSVLRWYNFDFTKSTLLRCKICNQNFLYRPKYKKIYLARTFSAEDTKYRYPITVRKRYSGILDFVDPLEFEKEDSKEIVETDTNLLLSCDITVAYMNKITAGTLSEIIISYMNKKTVYLISLENSVYNSPWIKCWYDKHFTSVDECYGYIVKECLADLNLDKMSESKTE